MYTLILLLTLAYPLKAQFIKTPDQVSPCTNLTALGNSYLEEIKFKMIAGKDIDKTWDQLEKLDKQFPNCLSFKKLNISETDLSKFKKYRSGNDTSFNLDQKDCTEYKVDTSNFPLNDNQGNLEWCFAYSSAHLLSHEEQVKLSAYDLAVTFHNSKNLPDTVNFTVTPGSPIETLNLAIKKTNGVCLEEEVNYTQGDWATLSSMVKNLHDANKKLISIFCENKFNEQETLTNFEADVLRVLDQLSPTKRADAFLNIQCKKRHTFSKNYTAHRMYAPDTKPEKIIEKVDELLSKGKPLTIVYSAELLSSGINFKGKPNHASTIIGREFNPLNGQCEYLIKNTWGKSSCENTSTPSIRCVDGNYWVPRTALKNNSNFISWLTVE